MPLVHAAVCGEDLATCQAKNFRIQMDLINYCRPCITNCWNNASKRVSGQPHRGVLRHPLGYQECLSYRCAINLQSDSKCYGDILVQHLSLFRSSASCIVLRSAMSQKLGSKHTGFSYTEQVTGSGWCSGMPRVRGHRKWLVLG